MSYSDGIAEQFEEAKVVSGGEQRVVSGERRGVDVGDVAVRRPDSLTGGAQNRRPAGPLDPLQLHKHTHNTTHTGRFHTSSFSVSGTKQTDSFTPLEIRWRRDIMNPSSSSSRSACTLTSQFLMVCRFPRGASKNSCSLAPVLTCSSLPAAQRQQRNIVWTKNNAAAERARRSRRLLADSLCIIQN